MKFKHMFIIGAIVAAGVSAGGTFAVATTMANDATEVAAASNANVVVALQNVSISNDGLLAPAIGSFYDASLLGTDAGVQSARMEATATRSYVVNSTRTAALHAEQTPDGVSVAGFTVDADFKITDVIATCETYEECAARLTNDPELLATPAQWFTPEQLATFIPADEPGEAPSK